MIFWTYFYSVFSDPGYIDLEHVEIISAEKLEKIQ